MQTVQQIAADIIANMDRNPHGFTAETLVAKWINDMAWLGFKPNGKAWQRELMTRARDGWIGTLKKTSVFIPPSEETLQWGGFLGGEVIPLASLRLEAEAAFAEKFGL